MSLASRAHIVQKLAVYAWLVLACTQAALAVPGFSAQKRVGHTTGDQWEPAIAADGRGHIYILYPQYGVVPDCPSCTSPAISLLISNDNGNSWQPPHALLPLATGQFDPQIVVDPGDRQTLYASWLQNDKRDTVVARSLDFGRTWSFSIADRAEEDADKPVLAVRGANVYVGFNHEEKSFVASSHDAGQTFSLVQVNPGAGPGWSLAGGATVDPAGNAYFGWTAFARRNVSTRPVSVFVSRSADAGRTWNSTLLDVSSAPPDCAAQGCETGYLGAQISLASDASGSLYALWNAGTVNGAPERMYFSSSTTAGQSWSAKASITTSGDAVESCFPAVVAGAAGDVRIAWMDTRGLDARTTAATSLPLWNTFYRSSTNGGATWSAEIRLSGPAHGYDYILPAGFRFPFGDYFGLAIDNQEATHVVWGEGRNYKSPGSIWYTHGR